MLVRNWLRRVHVKITTSGQRRLRQRRSPTSSPISSQVSLLEERLLLSAAVLGAETRVNDTTSGTQQFSPQSDRSIAVDVSGNSMAVWSAPTANGLGTNIVARRIDDSGNFLGSEIVVSTVSTGQRGNPVVGVNGNDRFVVVWESNGNSQDPGSYGIFARVLSIDGTPQTGEFRINGTTLGDQVDPSVAWLSPGEFVVTWSGVGQGDANNVFARKFNASGTAVSGEIRVNNFVVGIQQHPVVASLASGGFQVAWSGAGADDAIGIYSRLFDSAGNPVAGQFRVNTSNSAIEGQPSIARDRTNQVVIVWEATLNSLDSSGSAIIGRRFDLNGNALGPEFLINQTTAGNQFDPSITFLSDGTFVTAWQGAGNADSQGVYVRTFKADGAAQQDERLANSTGDGQQVNPTVRPLGTGFVTAWNGQGNGDSAGVFLQRFGQQQFLMPEDTRSAASDVLFFGNSDIGNVPLKTITITNTTKATIYPILRAANSKLADQQVGGKTVGLYDPYDLPNQEYRGYIGYEDQGKYYLGLRPGATIVVKVPLVFWDAARVYIATEGSDMIPKVDNNPAKIDDPNSPNPFHYHEFNQDKLTEKTARYTDMAENAKGTGGRIMWYHARSVGGTAEDVANDSATQLTEMTFRDPILGNSKFLTSSQIAESEKKALVNYDVSYVDSMLLPVAMAATDVPIPGYPSLPRASFAWIGANKSVKDMQDLISQFTSYSAANGLGDYFGGKGYNSFHLPDESVSGVKIPAGQNVIGESPLRDNETSYFPAPAPPGQPKPFELQSGGNMIRLDTQGTGTVTPGSKQMTNVKPEIVAQLTPGMLILNNDIFDKGTTIESITGTTVTLTNTAKITGPAGLSYTFIGTQASSAGTANGTNQLVLNNVGPRTNLVNLAPGMLVTGPNVPAGTKIVSVGKRDEQSSTITVTLSAKVPVSSGNTYTFVGPITDYVATTLMNLWYSWADFYVEQNNVPSANLTGTIASGGRTISFGSPVPDTMVPGMKVSSSSNVLSPGTTITAISADRKTVTLSKFVTGDGANPFTFDKPGEILRSGEVQPYKLTFDASDMDNAIKFARVVYAVMDAMSTIEPDKSLGSTATQIMYNVLGCNVGKIPGIGNLSNGQVSNAEISNEIRDNTKSIMRGVADFRATPEITGKWYPAPDIHTGGQSFNVYNLNPFVWFVHVKMGLSGYGFSVDDDVADVGAEGATKLQLVVGEVDNVPGFNVHEWTWGAPFGPVTSQTGQVDTNDHTILKGIDPVILKKINGLDKNVGPGATVTGPGIPDGTTVIEFFGADGVRLSQPATPMGNNAYKFSGPKDV